MLFRSPQVSHIGEGLRTYISEPLSPHGRTWTDKPAEQQAAYRANHRRIRGDRGKRLLRRRGEVVERTFAHLCETGGGRRTWLRGLTKVTKRYQVLTLSHNLGLILRSLLGTAKPRAFSLALSLWRTLHALVMTLRCFHQFRQHPQTTKTNFRLAELAL